MGMRIAAAQSLRCIRPLITSETNPSPLTTTMPLYRPSSMLLTRSEPCPAAVVCTTSVDTPAARSSGATEASYSVAAAPEPEAGLTSTRSGARAALPLALTAASTAAGAAPQPAASAALSDSSNAWPSAAVAAISSSRGWWTRCRSQPGVSPIGLFFACLWSDASYGAWLTVAASVPPAEPGATLMPAMSASGRRPAAGKPSSELTQRASAVSARAVAPGCALPSLRPAARRQCWPQTPAPPSLLEETHVSRASAGSRGWPSLPSGRRRTPSLSILGFGASWSSSSFIGRPWPPASSYANEGP